MPKISAQICKAPPYKNIFLLLWVATQEVSGLSLARRVPYTTCADNYNSTIRLSDDCKFITAELASDLASDLQYIKSSQIFQC